MRGYPDALATTFDVLLVLVGVKALTLLWLSARHTLRSARAVALPAASGPVAVSVIVPCFNEGPTLAHSVESLRRQRYHPIEIVVVDDGSTDDTAAVGAALAARYEDVTFVSQRNAGKASALNAGIRHSAGEIVVCMDADSALEPDAVAWLVANFQDRPQVVAVGGNVKVVNRRGLLGLHQGVEYISGLNLQRRCFATVGAMQVISGALGAFRRDALLAIGGFSHDTIVEDMDVTVALAAAGGEIRYEGRAIAHTEAPETFGGFLKQRHRWTIGGFQVLRKYRHIMFRRENRIGAVGLPYFLVLPWVDVAISSLFIASLVLVALSGAWLQLAFYYLALSTVSALLMLHSIQVDGRERRVLALAPYIEGLWYMHLVNLVTVWAAIDFVRGATVKWNKLERLGRNVLVGSGPVPAPAIAAAGVPAMSPRDHDVIIDIRDRRPVGPSGQVLERRTAPVDRGGDVVIDIRDRRRVG